MTCEAFFSRALQTGRCSWEDKHIQPTLGAKLHVCEGLRAASACCWYEDGRLCLWDKHWTSTTETRRCHGDVSEVVLDQNSVIERSLKDEALYFQRQSGKQSSKRSSSSTLKAVSVHRSRAVFKPQTIKEVCFCSYLWCRYEFHATFCSVICICASAKSQREAQIMCWWRRASACGWKTKSDEYFFASCRGCGDDKPTETWATEDNRRGKNIYIQNVNYK